MANNRSVCSAEVAGLVFNACVFNGQSGSDRGECAIYVAFGSKGSRAEVRTYGRAADLRRIGEAFIAAAANVEEVEGK